MGDCSTKEEYTDGGYSWDAVIGGGITECGETGTTDEEAREEFFRVVEEYICDQICFYEDLKNGLQELQRKES